MKGICLVSGGLDSTLALLQLLKEGHEVVPMFVNYDQWSFPGELEAILEIGDRLYEDQEAGKFVGRFTGTLLTDVKLTIDLDTKWGVGSVWGRNIALVGLAAMWAYTHGNDYDFIALGLHQGDVGPDCKPGLFNINLNNTLIEATKCKLELYLPIKDLTVEDIGKELGETGIPWNLMYSCYWYPHCRYKSVHDEYMCPGCRRKIIAMRAGGATPEQLALPPNAPGNGIGTFSYQSPLAEKVDY